jgi:hypothetical protein
MHKNNQLKKRFVTNEIQQLKKNLHIKYMIMSGQYYSFQTTSVQETTDDFSSFFVLIIAFAWVVAGIVAFLWSVVCFGKSGTAMQQVVGLLLAVFTGPVFFLYLYSVKKYCR